MPYKIQNIQKEYQKAWHTKNYDRIKLRMQSHSKQNKANVLAWFQEYKKSLKCIQCSENHPACLEFHHRHRRFKRFTISTAVGAGIRIKTLLKEIKKCDVLCSNCHRKVEWNKRHKQR